MAKEMTKKLRSDVERVIYEAFDKIDKTKTCSEHYKKIFADMSDPQFLKFISLRFPYRFHHKPFVVEPSMQDIVDGLDYLGIPLMEKVNMPDVYIDANGTPITTQEAMVVYVPIKRMQQGITKKNSMSTDISMRDMKTGLLTGYDKNGKTSDREIESLVILGLDNTAKEFSTIKADSMEAKAVAYNDISITGQVSQKDIKFTQEDSLSKNLLNTYLLGAHIYTNIINQDYYLPYTLKNKKKTIERIQ